MKFIARMFVYHSIPFSCGESTSHKPQPTTHNPQPLLLGAMEVHGCPNPDPQSTTHCRGTSLIRNSPPPQDPPRTLGIGLLKGPKGRMFLMSAVPLYSQPTTLGVRGDWRARVPQPGPTIHNPLQGYLAHKKQPPPPGPPRTLGIGLL